MSEPGNVPFWAVGSCGRHPSQTVIFNCSWLKNNEKERREKRGKKVTVSTFLID